MYSQSMVVIATLIVFIAAVAGIVILQVFLSKKESKWAGLILPAMSLFVSLTGALGVLLFSALTGTLTTTADGEIIEHTVTQAGDISSVILSAGYVFLLCNIPTGVFLAIYAACRGRSRQRRNLDKMSVQDLE